MRRIWRAREAETLQLVETAPAELRGNLDAAKADGVDLVMNDARPSVEADAVHIATLACVSACNLDPLSRGIGVASDAKIVPGLDPIPLPAEAQSYSSYVAGVSSDSTQPDAAKALIAFLTSPAVKQAWMAAGFEPR